MYELDFSDYRQFLAFFSLQEDAVPVQMIQHLHQHKELYTGNSILRDLDPLDNVFDPWFVTDDSSVYKRGNPEFRVGFHVCGWCVRKYLPRHLEKR